MNISVYFVEKLNINVTEVLLLLTTHCHVSTEICSVSHVFSPVGSDLWQLDTGYFTSEAWSFNNYYLYLLVIIIICFILCL